MVQALHKCTPPGPGGNGRVERRPQDQLRLFEGVLLTKVPEELKESPHSIGFLRKCRYSQFSCGEGAGPACMNDLVVNQ